MEINRMPICTVEREFERQRAADIIGLLEEKEYSLEASEWAARGFVSIAGNAMLTHSPESMADFLDDGGCEAVVGIMSKHSAVSVTIAQYCCLAICILSWSTRDMKDFLGEIGACELVAFTLSMHIGEPKVSEFGSRAFALLAKDNISNSYRLSEADGCDVLSQVGNFGFNIRSEKCIDVATNVCYAITYLCEAMNAQKLTDAGICSLIAALLKIHVKSAVFCEAAMKASCGLASLNLTLREELGRVGICEQLKEVCQAHPEEVTIIRDVCETIMHLTLSPTNTDKLSVNKGCEVLIGSLSNKKLIEIELGVEICTGALLNIITYGKHVKENNQKLRQLRCVELLKNAQLSTKVSCKARESILQLLSMLGDNNGGSGANGVLLQKSIEPNNKQTFVGVVHASEAIGGTIPLAVEITETVVYDSFADMNALSREQSLQSTDSNYNNNSNYSINPTVMAFGNTQKIYEI
eukprot:gene7319-9973_t